MDVENYRQSVYELLKHKVEKEREVSFVYNKDINNFRAINRKCLKN